MYRPLTALHGLGQDFRAQAEARKALMAARYGSEQAPGYTTSDKYFADITGEAHCPPGQHIVYRGKGYPPGGSTMRNYVMCNPDAAPAPPPPPPAPTINVQTQVSPSLQTQISPQISPNFFQAQQSPGATQAATTTQAMPGGQQANTGGTAQAPGASSQPAPASSPDNSAVILDFLKAQREADAQKQAEAEAERQKQIKALQDQAATQAAQAAQEKQARDAQAAQMQADYEAALKQSAQSAAPPSYQQEIAPGVQYIPADQSTTTPAPTTTAVNVTVPFYKRIPPAAFIIGAVLIGGVVFYLVRRKK